MVILTTENNRNTVISTLSSVEGKDTESFMSGQISKELFLILIMWKIMQMLGVYHIITIPVMAKKCNIRFIERSGCRRAILESLAVQGPRLFNSLPKHLHNITGCSKIKFKSALDKYLEKIPDEPHITGIQDVRLTDSNCLVDQI